MKALKAMKQKPEPDLHIVLIEPEIPQNTGNIGRLSLGLGARLHLVHPLGFQVDEKAVRRAGLDYWKAVDCVEHKSAAEFWEWLDDRPFHLFSTKGKQKLADVSYTKGCVLVFGPESRGLPIDWINQHQAATIPMTGDIRSLNLSNAVAVASYFAMMKIRPGMFTGA